MQDPRSAAGILVVLPALVDHPGVIAWDRAMELATSASTLHVLLLAGPVSGDDERATERLLTASQRTVQQWALAGTIGDGLAQNTHLHVATKNDAEAAVRTLVARVGIDHVFVAPCADTRSMVAGLATDPPCSLVLVSSAVERGEELGDAPPIQSAPLATPAPLPPPPVVSDAVG